MVMTPAGLRTKNDCADEDQQQFNQPTERGGLELDDSWSYKRVKYGNDSRGTQNEE
jgi:hypothetical protein